MNAPLAAAPQPNPTTRPYSQWFDMHPGLGISIIDHLFNRLDGAYPHKWRSAFATQDAIDNWAESWVEAFEEEGVTANDIKAGLKACRNRYDWPPSCAEFIKACKPSIDPMVAYYEALAGVQARAAGEAGKWSHRAIYWAAMPLAFDLKTQTYSQIKPRWERALAEQMALPEWEDIPRPMLQLTAPDPMSHDAAEKMIRTIKAAMVPKTAASKIDHKAWARRIVERERLKDPKLTLLQVRLAKEALAASELEVV